MMLIKTPRSRTNALVDFFLTALAWFVFCYLFVTGIWSILESATPGLSMPLVPRLLLEVHTLLAYVFVAAGIDLLLLAWAVYNALRFGGLDRRKAQPALTCAALAASFEISLELLKALRASQAMRIHHTDEGQINAIDFSRNPTSASDNILWISR